MNHIPLILLFAVALNAQTKQAPFKNHSSTRSVYQISKEDTPEFMLARNETNSRFHLYDLQIEVLQENGRPNHTGLDRSNNEIKEIWFYPTKQLDANGVPFTALVYFVDHRVVSLEVK